MTTTALSQTSTTDFNAAIRLDPRLAIAYRNRGTAYTGKGDYDSAIANYAEAIRLGDHIAYRLRGDTYLGMGRYDRAIPDYDEVLRVDSHDVSALFNRGRAYEVKDRNRAVEDYYRALAVPAKSQWDRDWQAEAAKRLAALQAPPPAVAALPHTPLGRRVALVIGNAGYKVGPLRNPGNDADAVAEALGKLGFDKVILRRDLGHEGFRHALQEFSREAASAGLGLVYFAGHGTEVNGKNYLIPIDAVLANASDLSVQAVSLDAVQDQLAGVTKLKLVILDACRNNPFPLAGTQRSGKRGLARIEPEENTLVVFAAKDGSTADDGVGRHSPFTEALLKRIATPGLEIRYLFGEVRDDVVAATAKRQHPHVYGTIGGTKFYLQH